VWFPGSDTLTLGNVFPGVTRTATWKFQAYTSGTKSFTARIWSENGGNVLPSTTGQVVGPAAPPGEAPGAAKPPRPVPAPRGAVPRPRWHVHGHRHGEEQRHEGLRHVDHALLPVPRRGEEHRRHPPEPDPRGADAGGRGEQHRDRDPDHPVHHAPQHVLPARL